MGNIVHAVLSFFSDLIVFTAGLAVLIFWIGVLLILAVELFDLIMKKVFGQDPPTSSLFGDDDA